VIDAKQEKRTCQQLCKDDFLAAVDSCRGVDHDCADTARDARHQCVSDVLTELSQCVTTNCAVFVQGIADCRAAHEVGTPERDACVDGQQLLLFQCRDSCRESVMVWASLKTLCQELRRTSRRAGDAGRDGAVTHTGRRAKAYKSDRDDAALGLRHLLDHLRDLLLRLSAPALHLHQLAMSPSTRIDPHERHGVLILVHQHRSSDSEQNDERSARHYIHHLAVVHQATSPLGP
jgi:hypothetical protein